MKRVYAVAPYNHGINFKMQVYDAWVKMGWKTMPSHYPWRIFHKFAYNYELPTFHKNEKIAQLRFVEPVSLNFDTFPDYTRYEIIPMVWDCWPVHFEKTCNWLKKHNVQTAIFTSSQTAKYISKHFPKMNIIIITEGIDTSRYNMGKELRDREIDVLEFGRNNGLFKSDLPATIVHKCSKGNKKLFLSNEDFYQALQDSKITICLPRCDTQPLIAGNIETLTQRYWEAMLSRMIIIGRAPQELVELIGYNPVIEVNRDNAEKKIQEILCNLDDYQHLVDKNRKTALKMGDWAIRIKCIINALTNLNYYV
jgi:hypothetical protein